MDAALMLLELNAVELVVVLRRRAGARVSPRHCGITRTRSNDMDAPAMSFQLNAA
jgi:hypothetical protein